MHPTLQKWKDSDTFYGYMAYDEPTFALALEAANPDRLQRAYADVADYLLDEYIYFSENYPGKAFETVLLHSPEIGGTMAYQKAGLNTFDEYLDYYYEKVMQYMPYEERIYSMDSYAFGSTGKETYIRDCFFSRLEGMAYKAEERGAEKLLVTAVAQSRNTGAEISADGTTITSLGTAPILVQPVLGKIVLKTYDDFDVYILNSSGVRADDRKASVEKNENGFTVITMKLGDNATYYEIVRTKVSETKPSFGSYRDIGGEYANAIEAIKNYMPGKTETLFLTEEIAERGDFVGAVVRASGLTGGNRAYADANSNHQSYEQFKTAREYSLVDGLQIKAYDALTYKAAYYALYKSRESERRCDERKRGVACGGGSFGLE